MELARERNDGPAIWVLKDNDTTLYLFGTVHLLPSNLSWQKSDMQKAFASSGTIFFEANSEANEKVAANILANEGYNTYNVSDGFSGNGQDPGWKNLKLPSIIDS